ncbi:hypothetical protein [Halomonas sp. PGE1]|uniref:hypothetical protein n=1 Tax=Halomonas sp. PGE1 TaxID=2730360 RepID=UPI0032D593D9
MNASLAGMFALGTGFLLVLFLCALAVERGLIGTRITRHPLVYTLALGVYASAWAIYGSLELASTSGYGYLAYYLGVAGAFLLAPVLLVPIQRMTRTYQLASLSDLFAFRFRSRWVGTLITLISLLAVLPLLALQVQTMGDAIFLMTGAASPSLLALAFCAMIALFAMLFGARQGRVDGHHDSLLAVIALSSLVKVVAMLGLGAFSLFVVFDGPADLQTWLDGPGQAFQADVIQPDPAHWRTLLLLFFAAALLMPHIFHITFTETHSRHTLLQASWALPLFLLLMALPVPLILWAGQRLGAGDLLPSAYLAFGLSESLWIQSLAFIAGLAATSATMVLIALALAGMILNHVLLVAHPPRGPAEPLPLAAVAAPRPGGRRGAGRLALLPHRGRASRPHHPGAGRLRRHGPVPAGAAGPALLARRQPQGHGLGAGGGPAGMAARPVGAAAHRPARAGGHSSRPRGPGRRAGVVRDHPGLPGQQRPGLHPRLPGHPHLRG